MEIKASEYVDMCFLLTYLSSQMLNLFSKNKHMINVYSPLHRYAGRCRCTKPLFTNCPAAALTSRTRLWVSSSETVVCVRTERLDFRAGVIDKGRVFKSGKRS